LWSHEIVIGTSAEKIVISGMTETAPSGKRWILPQLLPQKCSREHRKNAKDLKDVKIRLTYWQPQPNECE
jgi:hypothetical protein